MNDWEVAKTLARVPFPYKRSLADEWILSTWAQIAAGEAWHLAIVGEEPGPDGPAETLIGCVALTLDADRRQAELGYWVGRRYWGHGVATEAAGRLCRWALAQLEITGIHASALRDNARSAAVLRRLGFRPAGEAMQTFLSRGAPMPVNLFHGGREELTGDAGPAAGAAAAPWPARPSCSSPRWRWSMPMAACCWPAGPRASPGRALGIPRRQGQAGETPRPP
ncbi:GNAT family N-acetyltransferase [Paeniroseomonas aquatica]|uniref:GNAT family N-acetyltransferase n=1 Tax=Paeniroseomonas aquatica TaxID=373043 RepID=UPI003605E82C